VIALLIFGVSYHWDGIYSKALFDIFFKSCFLRSDGKKEQSVRNMNIAKMFRSILETFVMWKKFKSLEINMLSICFRAYLRPDHEPYSYSCPISSQVNICLHEILCLFWFNTFYFIWFGLVTYLCISAQLPYVMIVKIRNSDGKKYSDSFLRLFWDEKGSEVLRSISLSFCFESIYVLIVKIRNSDEPKKYSDSFLRLFWDGKSSEVLRSISLSFCFESIYVLIVKIRNSDDPKNILIHF